jgi:hypothetical protein
VQVKASKQRLPVCSRSRVIGAVRSLKGTISVSLNTACSVTSVRRELVGSEIET